MDKKSNKRIAYAYRDHVVFLSVDEEGLVTSVLTINGLDTSDRRTIPNLKNERYTEDEARLLARGFIDEIFCHKN